MLLWEKIRGYNLEIVNFVVGAAVLAFELTAARIATPYIGNTVYTWTSIIGVILAALALGYWIGGKLADARKLASDVVALLLLAAAWLLIISIVKDGVLRSLTDNNFPLQIQALFIATILFALPTLLLGAVSPYLTRLSLKDLKTSGQRVARMSAWGTVGSLFGTFATGYVLFGYLGTKRILFLLVLVLVVISFVLTQRDYLLYRLLLTVAAILSIIVATPLPVKGLVQDVDTHYARVVVRDVQLGNRPLRVLQTDGDFFQSGVFKDDTKELAFGYTRALSFISKLRPNATRQLVVGGGAFTLPEQLARAYPASTIDTVEIDEDLIELSKKYFNFEQPDNLKIFSEDGRAFLNRSDTQYDLVYMDAYGSLLPPFQLFTQEAVAQIGRHLSEDGIAAANIISPTNNEPIQSIAKTYGTVFKHVVIFPVGPDVSPERNQNLILVASNSKLTPEDLLSAAQTEEEKRFVSGLFTLSDDKGLVMTDDFAPLERFSSANL